MTSHLRTAPSTAGKILVNSSSGHGPHHQLADQNSVVAWTGLISTYTSSGRPNLAWLAFLDMLGAAVRPNAYTVSNVLKAGKGVDGGRRSGPLLHGLATKLGVHRNIYVENAVVEAYAWGDAMGDAYKVFEGMGERSVVSWTTVVSGHMRRGQGEAAMVAFRRMLQDGVEMNEYSCSIALNACASLGLVPLGKQLHAAAAIAGLTNSLPVVNTVIDMYCKCFRMSDAHLCFNNMPERDVITWNTMIAGLKRIGSVDALHLFSQMSSIHGHIKPNCFTLTTVIAACANLAALHCGQQIHGFIIRQGFEQNLALGNALMDMYAKCGSIACSRNIFDGMEDRDLVSWTTLMLGYGNHGRGQEAIRLFDQMIVLGYQPDGVVFMGLLCACSHARLLDDGLEYFHSMHPQFGVPPDLPIYGCVVDMLGRAGRLEEAHELINTMPSEADESIWGALLAACKLHRNMALGKLAASKMLGLRPQDKSDALIFLSNIFAADGEWMEFAKTRKLMKEMGNKKEAGMSWIELRGDVYSFAMGETTNPCLGSVCEVLKNLNVVMKDAGYMPNQFT